MGIEVSLIGYLVFFMLYINSVSETVTRFVDMGLDLFSFADFFEYGEEDGNSIWPFGIAIDEGRDRVYCSDEWANTISVFDSSGKFIEKWGATGSGDGELLRPAGIAVEKNGNVIVVDSGNNRLQVFSPEGKFIGKCGGPGKGPGEFNQPWGITLDKDGNIYVADWKNHRIQKLTSAGIDSMAMKLSVKRVNLVARRSSIAGSITSGAMRSRPQIRWPSTPSLSFGSRV